MAFRVVAEHKKKSTCMGASVPESVGEEKKAGFVRVHYYMWETFLFFPRRTREGPSGSSQSLPGSRTGGGQGLQQPCESKGGALTRSLLSPFE